jgi:hypothetical protein
MIAVPAIATLGIAAFVYSGPGNREAMTGIAREFFVSVEKASRAKRHVATGSSSPASERGVTIQ